MGQVIEELYFDRLPVDLFRHGSAASPQLHKPRTVPPRQLVQIHDIKIYKKEGIDWVESESGGISLFNMINPRFGDRWWKLAKGTKLPVFLRVSRDSGIHPVTGQIHYTLRPVHDMPLSVFVQSLKTLSAFATPHFAASQSKA